MGIFKKFANISRAGLEAGVGAVKSVVDVPRQFAELGSDLGSAASRAVDKARGVNSDKSKNFLEMGSEGTDFSRPTNTAQKVGFAAGEIAQLATPAGTAKGAATGAKLAKTLGAGEKAVKFASKLGGLSLNSLVQGGISTVQSGSIKEGATTAATNLIANPVITGAGKIASSIAKTASSAFGGTAPEILEKAFRNPAEVRKAINFAMEEGEEAMTKISADTRKALEELKEVRKIAYQDNLAKVKKSDVKGISLDGVKKSLEDTLAKFKIKVSGPLLEDLPAKASEKVKKAVATRIDKEDLAVMSDFTDYIAGDYKLGKEAADILKEDAKRIAEHYKIEVPKSLRSLANKFGTELEEHSWQPFIDKGKKQALLKGVVKPSVDTSASKFPTSYKPKVQALVDELNDWKDMSPEGMDVLLSRLNNLRLESTDAVAKPFNKMVDDVVGDLEKYVSNVAPEVGVLRADYAGKSKLIDNILDEVLNGKESTSVRKLANMFSPNNYTYRKIISELGEKTGRDFLADIAGVVLAKGTPKGLGKYLTTLAGTQLSGQGAAAILPGVGQMGALATLPAVAVAASPRLSGEVALAASKIAPAVKPAIRAASGLVGKALNLNDNKKIPVETPANEGPTQINLESLQSQFDPQYSEFIKAAVEQGYSQKEIMDIINEKTR